MEDLDAEVNAPRIQQSRLERLDGLGYPQGASLARSSPYTRKFVDLFAGIGGFHVALERLGHSCVLACEVDETLRKVYMRNFGIAPVGDIRYLTLDQVPDHDVLCAGFPCQPFSLAGKLQGEACDRYGQLINHVLRIVEAKRPTFVMLENVPNVISIRDGRFWSRIKRTLSRYGYALDQRILSPEQFGIPQRRNRLFVVASRIGLGHFQWPQVAAEDVKPLSGYIDHDAEGVRQIEAKKVKAIDTWNRFVKRLKHIKSHTVLAAEFGATYPTHRHPASYRNWRAFRGAFGASLKRCASWEDALPLLPHYARRSRANGVAHWVRPFIEYSRKLYKLDEKYLDKWKLDVVGMPNSWQKLEWRGDRRFMDIWKQTIQFRASGIRTMNPAFAPSLVAMTPTQTPIIGVVRRYMMLQEAAALQSLEGLRAYPENNERAFRALGNAVNALIVERIAKRLIV